MLRIAALHFGKSIVVVEAKKCGAKIAKKLGSAVPHGHSWYSIEVDLHPPALNVDGVFTYPCVVLNATDSFGIPQYVWPAEVFDAGTIVLAKSDGHYWPTFLDPAYPLPEAKANQAADGYQVFTYSN